jgi:hypothetical protein
VAGLLAAVYSPLIFCDGLIEKEGLAALVSAVALGLTARAMPGGPWWAAAAGFAWGVLTLLRSNALIIAPLGAIWLAFSSAMGHGERQPSRSRRVARVASFLFAFGLALAPAAAVNAYVGRPPELLLNTWQMGPNFYIGNGPEATGTYHSPAFVEANPAREADDFAGEARRRLGRELTPGQVSWYWLFQGLQRWRDAPGPSFELLAYKTGLLAHDFEISDSLDQEFVRLVAAPTLALGFLSFGWLSPWVVAGLGRAFRSPFWWFLVLSTAAGLVSTAAFFVVGRYRIPWAPGLFLLAAAGLVDQTRRALSREWRVLLWVIALLMVPATVLAWRPLKDPAPERWGHALIGMALADALAGQLEPAIDALDDARALGPGPAQRVEQLTTSGPLHDAMGMLIASRPEADKHPGQGLESDLRLARWMRQFPKGRAQSWRLLNQALEAEPDNPRVNRERGAWWLGQTDDPDARLHAFGYLLRASQGRTGDASSAVLLALLVRDPSFLPSKSTGLPAARLRLVRAILKAHDGGVRWGDASSAANR